MYRLILLFYVVRAFCKTSCALLFQDKTNRTIKKIKFFSAALRTGCFNRHQGLIGTYAAIDYFFDLYTVFFTPPVLNNMSLVIAVIFQHDCSVFCACP